MLQGCGAHRGDKCRRFVGLAPCCRTWSSCVGGVLDLAGKEEAEARDTVCLLVVLCSVCKVESQKYLGIGQCGCSEVFRDHLTILRANL